MRMVPMVRFHTRAARWAAALIGCVIATLAWTAWFLHARAGDPQVLALALSAAAWFSWVAFDFALAPLRATRVAAPPKPHKTVIGLPLFVDTEAAWADVTEGLARPTPQPSIRS